METVSLTLREGQRVVVDTPQGRIEIVGEMLSPGTGDPMTQITLYPHAGAIAHTPTYFSANGEALTAYIIESPR